MASWEWTSPTNGNTKVVNRNSTATIAINVDDCPGPYYTYRFKIVQDNYNVKINGSYGTIYSSSFASKDSFYSSITVQGISAGTTTLTFSVQGEDGGGWHDIFTPSSRNVSIIVPADAGVYDLRGGAPDPSVLKTNDILICPYSGAIKYCTLPKGTYKLEVWGAKGSDTEYNAEAQGDGGNGGYTQGIFTVASNTATLYCVTGGMGSRITPTYSSASTSVSGGYNGGGNGYFVYGPSSAGVSELYGAGGGCSHIATSSGLLSTLSSQQDKILLAAAGGGGGLVIASSSAVSSARAGGYGGGTTGGNGNGNNYGGGGTPSAGGSSPSGYPGTFGQGGDGYTGSNTASSGGGGGWYGGGAGKCLKPGTGGGGSAYYNTTLLTNCSTVAGNASMPTPEGGTETGHGNDGYIKITIIEIAVVTTPFYVNVNGTWKQCTNAYVNVNGTWKEVIETKTNVGGSWK